MITRELIQRKTFKLDPLRIYVTTIGRLQTLQKEVIEVRRDGNLD